MRPCLIVVASSFCTRRARPCIRQGRAGRCICQGPGRAGRCIRHRQTRGGRRFVLKAYSKAVERSGRGSLLTLHRTNLRGRFALEEESGEE